MSLICGMIGSLGMVDALEDQDSMTKSHDGMCWQKRKLIGILDDPDVSCWRMPDQDQYDEILAAYADVRHQGIDLRLALCFCLIVTVVDGRAGNTISAES